MCIRDSYKELWCNDVDTQAQDKISEDEANLNVTVDLITMEELEGALKYSKLRNCQVLMKQI